MKITFYKKSLPDIITINQNIYKRSYLSFELDKFYNYMSLTYNYESVSSKNTLTFCFQPPNLFIGLVTS